MVLIRNTSVDPPYIYFMFNGGTLDLKKTHSFFYMSYFIASSRKCMSLLSRSTLDSLRLSRTTQTVMVVTTVNPKIFGGESL